LLGAARAATLGIVHPATALAAAREFAARLAAAAPARVRSITLFGSRARGEGRPDSDIDLFVLVDRRDAGLLDTIYGIAQDVDLERLTYLSVKVCPVARRDEMRRLGDPFLTAVEREGIVLWTPTSKDASVTG
jgi:predicted nucleotidyltransferase